MQSPPLSKTAYVVQRIREEIRSGVIVPGEPLRQTDIAERYGVSATPVREALRLLSVDGTISYSPHRGATVRELSADAIRDLYLLRAEIEGLATALAVERMTEDGYYRRIAELHEDLAAMHGEGDAGEMSNRNRELHFAIYSGSSPIITSQVERMWAALPTRLTLWRVPEYAWELTRQHEGIVEAIGARDPELARARMREHILAAAKFREELSPRSMLWGC
ncbi:MAG: FCD domain-containing protein [Streptosporangiales bacterium]|nr:FCD domain-containing protein [Streptosporangiales bacterium]